MLKTEKTAVFLLGQQPYSMTAENKQTYNGFSHSFLVDGKPIPASSPTVNLLPYLEASKGAPVEGTVVFELRPNERQYKLRTLEFVPKK